MKTVDLSRKNYISIISDPKGTAFRGTQVRIQFSCTFETPYTFKESLEHLISFWECPDCLFTLETGQKINPHDEVP